MHGHERFSICCVNRAIGLFALQAFICINSIPCCKFSLCLMTEHWITLCTEAARAPDLSWPAFLRGAARSLNTACLTSCLRLISCPKTAAGVGVNSCFEGLHGKLRVLLIKAFLPSGLYMIINLHVKKLRDRWIVIYPRPCDMMVTKIGLVPWPALLQTLCKFIVFLETIVFWKTRQCQCES